MSRVNSVARFRILSSQFLISGSQCCGSSTRPARCCAIHCSLTDPRSVRPADRLNSSSVIARPKRPAPIAPHRDRHARHGAIMPDLNKVRNWFSGGLS